MEWLDKLNAKFKKKEVPEVEEYKLKDKEIKKLSESFISRDEKYIASLGNGYIMNYFANKSIKRGFAYITNKRVYFKGSCLSGTGKYLVKTDEERTVDVKNITGSGFIYQRYWGTLIALMISLIASLFGVVYDVHCVLQTGQETIAPMAVEAVKEDAMTPNYASGINTWNEMKNKEKKELLETIRNEWEEIDWNIDNFATNEIEVILPIKNEEWLIALDPYNNSNAIDLEEHWVRIGVDYDNFQVTEQYNEDEFKILAKEAIEDEIENVIERIADSRRETFNDFMIGVVGIVIAMLYGGLGLICCVGIKNYLIKRKTLFRIEYAGGCIAFDVSFYAKAEIDDFQKQLRRAKDMAVESTAISDSALEMGEDVSTQTKTVDDLRKYNELLKDGIITQEEYDAVKKNILGI